MREVKTDKCFPIRADVFRFIDKCSEQFDFIFADPPYALKDLESIPTVFSKAGFKGRRIIGIGTWQREPFRG